MTYIDSMIHTSIPARTRVAVATASDRTEAIMRALDCVSDDIRAKVRGRVMVKPNFLSSTHGLSSTHAGAVGAVLDFLGDTDAESVVVAEGGSRSTEQAFDNFGYRTVMDKYDAGTLDLNHVPHPLSFETITARGGVQTVEYADIRSVADTVISVPVAKTHDSASLTLSIKNMMGCLRRVHRPRMHGIVIGDGVSRAAEFLWNAVEGHPLVIKSFSGAVFTLVNGIRARDNRRGTSSQASSLTGLVRQIGAMAENIARMAAVLMPDIAVIDAFEAMEGDGPGIAGTRVSMGAAVAGTDPVACDAVMAHLMGFDPMDIGYLRLLHERGMGVADLGEIDIAGDDPEAIARRFRPHRNHASQLRWREGLEAITAVKRQ